MMFLAGMIEDPADKAAVRNKTSTFYRRYRHHPDFPEPVNLPDGALSVWEDEFMAFLESRGRTDNARANVAPLPAHYARGNQRGKSHLTDSSTPPRAA
jgi:hypothetical protein